MYFVQEEALTPTTSIYKSINNLERKHKTTRG